MRGTAECFNKRQSGTVRNDRKGEQRQLAWVTREGQEEGLHHQQKRESNSNIHSRHILMIALYASVSVNNVSSYLFHEFYPVYLSTYN